MGFSLLHLGKRNTNWLLNFNDCHFVDEHNYQNIITVTYLQILISSAPLFDITLDIAENFKKMSKESSNPARFALKIGPPILENTQYENKKEQECYDNQKSENMSENVNLHLLYEGLKKCKVMVTVVIIRSWMICE